MRPWLRSHGRSTRWSTGCTSRRDFNEAVALLPRKAMNFFAGDPDFMWLQ